MTLAASVAVAPGHHWSGVLLGWLGREWLKRHGRRRLLPRERPANVDRFFTRYGPLIGGSALVVPVGLAITPGAAAFHDRLRRSPNTPPPGAAPVVPRYATE